MSKGEYAAHRGVSPGRISQYIADGQIGPSALEGEGRRARIIVEIADRHLGQRLDQSQALGANGKAAAAVIDGSTGRAELEAPPLEPGPSAADNHLRIVAEEKAKQAKMQTERMAREEAAQTGRYMLTADARTQITRAASEAFTVMEAAIRDMAMALAAEHGLSKSEAMTLLTRCWRDSRKRASAGFKADAEAQPVHVEDATDDDAAHAPELAA